MYIDMCVCKYVYECIYYKAKYILIILCIILLIVYE